MDKNNIFTNLPVDVLGLIMKHLSLKDCLELRATCRSWRKMISNAIENKHCCHLPELPLVFLQSKTSDSSFFSSLSTNSGHPLGTPLGRTNSCIGSFEGWLIMSDYSEIGFAKFFFVNPVTDVRIMIPSKLSLPSNGNRISYVRKMVASFGPNCDGSNCYLVCLLTVFCHIAICNLFDKSWTIIKSDNDSKTYFRNVETIGTKLYVLDSSSYSILVYDLKDSINGPPKAQVLAKIPERIVPQSSIISNHCVRFLSKDEVLRELYFIYIFCNAKPEYDTRHVAAERLKSVLSYAEPPEIISFEVFKLDTNKDPIEWQNVKLEDKMAFVSNCNGMILSRDTLNCNNESITWNSICFAVHFPCPTSPWQSLKFGKFCLTDSSIKYFPVETSNHGDDVPYPIWFVPSLC